MTVSSTESVAGGGDDIMTDFSNEAGSIHPQGDDRVTFVVYHNSLIFAPKDFHALLTRKNAVIRRMIGFD